MVNQIQPKDLCKSGTEFSEQRALICWAGLPEVQEVYPDARKIFAINNNAGMGDKKKGATRGMMAKQAGVKAGVCDLFLPVARHGVYGLFIEMKQTKLKPKTERSKGGVSQVQSEFIEQVRADGYGVVVCYGWLEASKILSEYLTP